MLILNRSFNTNVFVRNIAKPKNMEEKFNESTTNRPKGDRILDATLVAIDLPSYVKQLKEEEAWQKNDRNAITVFKTADMNIIVVAMHANAEMKPPVPSEGITSLHVLEGRVRLDIGDQTSEVNSEQIVAFHGHQSFTLTATNQTVFLLTMTNKHS